jgi:hypothetical protein
VRPQVLILVMDRDRVGTAAYPQHLVQVRPGRGVKAPSICTWLSLCSRAGFQRTSS